MATKNITVNVDETKKVTVTRPELVVNIKTGANDWDTDEVIRAEVLENAERYNVTTETYDTIPDGIEVNGTLLTPQEAKTAGQALVDFAKQFIPTTKKKAAKGKKVTSRKGRKG